MTLLDAARAVRENAYAPYSRFKVGAALRATSGAVHLGCNVENVAYPEGTCAEAGAIAAMIAAGDTAIAELVVIADSPAPVPPCGGCLPACLAAFTSSCAGAGCGCCLGFACVRRWLASCALFGCLCGVWLWPPFCLCFFSRVGACAGCCMHVAGVF